MSGLDLYQTQGALLGMLAWAFVSGICLGGFYDLLRALRIFFIPDEEQGSRRFRWVSYFAADLLLVIVASVAMILLCYYTNDGLLRGPAVWGMASGFFVYVQTVGRLTVRVEMLLSRFLRGLIRSLGRLVSRPVVWVGARLLGWIRALWQVSFGKAIAKHRMRRIKRRQSRQSEAQNAKPLPQRGTTVFSTRRQI